MSRPASSDPADPGKAAIITGAGSPSGIGAAVARRLSIGGYALMLVDVDPAVGATAVELCAELGTPPDQIVAWVGDVAADGDIDAAVVEAVDRFGRVDVAVANAGGGGTELDVVELEDSEFDRIVSLNIRGTYLTCKAAGRVMREARRGAIVTVSSIFALEPAAGTVPYAAAKAGIVALTQALAKELAPYGVRANSVAPGYIATGSLLQTEAIRAARAGISLDDRRRNIEQRVPLGRYGTADDVAAAISFLVSDDASYITGHTLGVTGGIVMR